MEKSLPPGFRFHPTDEELVIQYLKRKVLGCPLPSSVIPDISLFRLSPWDLPGCGEKERYFFTEREGKNRAGRTGFWKAAGSDRPVQAGRSGLVVGLKRALVFYRRRAGGAAKTDWCMHEYRLLLLPSLSLSKACVERESPDWVLCRVFRKRKPSKNRCLLGRRSVQESEPSCLTEAEGEDGTGEVSSSSALS
ncbi:NAC domain-containing protein 83-like [Wolffia australiana]